MLTIMEKQAARDALLTKFKPKEKNLDTPYLVAPDGTSLDGELKLVGLSGKEAIELRQMATKQVINAEGKAEAELDNVKLTGLTLIRCLYHRESNEPLLSQVIPSNGDAADLQEILGIDQEPFNALSLDVQKFLGLNKDAATDAKKNLKKTQNDSSTTTSQTGSDGSGQ